MAKQILCIDDSPEILDLLSHALSAAGYEITLADDGEKGLAIAVRKAFDLIICDIMMPRIDGFDLCKQLRENTATRHTPILILSARRTPLTERTAKLAGANAYLPKPFRLADLTRLADDLTTA